MQNEQTDGNFDTNVIKLVTGQTDQSFVADLFETNIT